MEHLTNLFTHPDILVFVGAIFGLLVAGGASFLLCCIFDDGKFKESLREEGILK